MPSQWDSIPCPDVVPPPLSYSLVRSLPCNDTRMSVMMGNRECRNNQRMNVAWSLKHKVEKSMTTCHRAVHVLQGRVIYYSLVDPRPTSGQPSWPSSSAHAQLCLRRSMAPHEVRVVIKLLWWAGGRFNEAGPCFHPDLWGPALQVFILKGTYRLAWWSRRFQTSPTATAGLWHFHPNLLHPADYFFSQSLHKVGCIYHQSNLSARWTGCCTYEW